MPCHRRSLNRRTSLPSASDSHSFSGPPKGETETSYGKIIPLPVRLFVEEAVRLLYLGQSLDELPVSLPGVYMRYLERVNPKDPTGTNFMTDEEFLRAAMVLAKLALGENYVPKEFFKDDAREALKSNAWTDQTKVEHLIPKNARQRYSP